MQLKPAFFILVAAGFLSVFSFSAEVFSAAWSRADYMVEKYQAAIPATLGLYRSLWEQLRLNLKMDKG
ncbi:hypothetical protein [uncultured Microbulbifer sp.]|uniref:hypothetical protein n=1 Tax=uncultured Microbulbifer sp. TaxID=348147 RepID=UPI002616AA2D|nr:hypothetical protein [uncultured Microbulbifer sp.]